MEKASDFVLRPATPADASALARLGSETFLAKFGHMYSDENNAAFLAEVHSETAVSAEIANPEREYCLAERDGELIAYAKVARKTGWPQYARSGNTVELKQLYTAPHLIGGGIGKALMQWALDWAAAEKAGEMHLSVWSGNLDAQRFYARFGFSKLADITYRVGEQIDEEFLFARML